MVSGVGFWFSSLVGLQHRWRCGEWAALRLGYCRYAEVGTDLFRSFFLGVCGGLGGGLFPAGKLTRPRRAASVGAPAILH